ncbi:MAG: hypothetical protein OXF84_07475 [Bacteroidetes bacterium]|nr:hypothetical protein [Bacteroidota bacterium]
MAHTDKSTTDPPPIQNEAIAAVPLMWFIFSILFGLGLLSFVASYWFNNVADRVHMEHAAEASYPTVERLQMSGMQQLNRYEMISEGVFRIPIEQAILHVAEEFPEDAPISEEMVP